MKGWDAAERRIARITHSGSRDLARQIAYTLGVHGEAALCHAVERCAWHLGESLSPPWPHKLTTADKDLIEQRVAKAMQDAVDRMDTRLPDLRALRGVER